MGRGSEPTFTNSAAIVLIIEDTEGGMRRMGENKRGLPEERAHNGEVFPRDFPGLRRVE